MTNTINFTASSYVGSPVVDATTKLKIKRLKTLNVGRKIYVRSLFGTEMAVVQTVENDAASALSRNGNTIYWLHHGRDDRKCWVCDCSGNAKAIARVKFD